MILPASTASSHRHSQRGGGEHIPLSDRQSFVFILGISCKVSTEKTIIDGWLTPPRPTALLCPCDELLVGKPEPDLPAGTGRRLSVVPKGECERCEESVLRVHARGCSRRCRLFVREHPHPGHWHRSLLLLRIAEAGRLWAGWTELEPDWMARAGRVAKADPPGSAKRSHRLATPLPSRAILSSSTHRR